MGIKFERKFLRPEDLLLRWQCSEADLKYEVIEGNLPPIIFVNKPEDITDREGLAVFGPDEDYILQVDDLFGPVYGNRGYLVLRSPIREGIDTCSFSLFNQYQEVWDDCVCLPPGMIPFEKYWSEMVFDLPTILKFEAERTQGANLSDSKEKPLSTRERDTLLTIIAALAKAAKVPLDDYSKPGKAAGYIEGLTDEFGAHVSKRAIEDHLKKIPDALETRMK